MRFGTYEDSYHNLPPLLEVMQARNPGTHMAILDEVNEYGENVLRRAFWSFGCMIEAFRNCIPLLCVDGTFMTGKYRGTILTAIGVDADSHVVPVVFAFVESENTSSWLWFLRHIKMCVVENRPNVCVLHDRHAGLLSAIQKLQEDVTQSVPWPDLYSRWCMRHFGANFYRQFRSKRLMDLFKKLCKQNQQRKFDAIWDQLDRLTTTHMEEVRKKPIVARQEEPEELEPIPNEAPSITRRRKRGRATKCFTEWVEFEPREKWSLLYDTDGSRYGVMTTNLAEVYNWVMKNTRPLPLVAILEGITRGTQKYLCKRYSMASLNLSKPSVKYSPAITQYMDEKSKKGGIHRVWPAGNRELLFEIRLRDKSGVGIGTTDITLECTLWPEYHACKCNCNKPYLLHRPCSHVLAASAKGGVDGNIFVSPYFRKESWEATWRGELRGWRAVCDFTRPPPGQANWVPDSNLLVDTKGRRQSRRIKNLMDEAEVKDRSRRMADQYDGQLIDKEIDRNHRSRRLSTGTFCNVLKMQGPDQYWRIDPRWVSRLRAAGLLTFARLVEPSRARSERIYIDAALLSALVDRWRPETHTFHLTVGEMVPTLQDVSYLLGLPIAGPTVGPTMEEWIVQRHLVAYLLWLFGWVMFTGTHADSVDKHFIHFAEQIAELPIAEIPQYSWGSAVLAATYAGLCDACVRNSKQSSLPGCPLLIMLWAHERFDIGRPQLDSYANYGLREMYRYSRKGLGLSYELVIVTTVQLTAEFVEHVHVESDTLLQRREARPPVVRPDDVASILRNFRAALLRRVSCRSAADVGASGSAHFPYMPTGDNVLNTPAWGLHITPRAPEQGHTQHTSFIEDFFSTDPPQGEVGMDYWHATPQVTQPTQETEAGQGPDVTPQQAARDRHPPDNLTYPTEQIRRRKKGGPSKRAKGTDRP
uniref:OSJNBa0073L13.8 protein n=1 Tax=Oryza sativa subsp. japonica TaxID=39947 RepID=Q7XSI0_ORYSJ|nr:OSJNBa0073L13.8 [Oryza sativa Japonica Group]